MAEQEFLKAFVEFVARGVDTVRAAADSIEKKIFSVPGKKDVEFRATGQESVTAAVGWISDGLGGLKKAAEVKFTASGTDKVEGAANTIKQKMAQLAHSGDLTRMLSGGIEEALRTAGEGAGGAIAAGMGGLIGGAIGASVGAQLAHLALEIPRELGKHNDMKAALTAGLTEEDKAKYEEMHERQHDVWRGTSHGWEDFQKGLRHFQTEGINPAEAEKAMTRIMTLAEGTGRDPVSLAESYARMMAVHSPRNTMALVRQSPEVVKALKQMFPQYAGDEEQGLMPAIQKGKIGTADVAEAVHRAAVNPVVTGRVDEPRQTSDLERGTAWSKLGNYWLEAGRVFLHNTLHPFNREKYMSERETPESVKQLPGMEPASSRPWEAHPEPVSKVSEYSFTSLSGLAEKMQQEAAGGGDVQERQLGVLEQIRDKLPEDKKPHPGGGPQPQSH